MSFIHKMYSISFKEIYIYFISVSVALVWNWNFNWYKLGTAINEGMLDGFNFIMVLIKQSQI